MNFYSIIKTLGAKMYHLCSKRLCSPPAALHFLFTNPETQKSPPHHEESHRFEAAILQAAFPARQEILPALQEMFSAFSSVFHAILSKKDRLFFRMPFPAIVTSVPVFRLGNGQDRKLDSFHSVFQDKELVFQCVDPFLDRVSH